MLAVALGGALGAAGRYATSQWALKLFGDGFPWATLVVNLLGAFAMGALVATAGRERWLMLLIGTGVLGGFTTFSAFSLETALMIERGAYAPALLYALASVLGCVLALFAGLWIARWLG